VTVTALIQFRSVLYKVRRRSCPIFTIFSHARFTSTAASSHKVAVYYSRFIVCDNHNI